MKYKEVRVQIVLMIIVLFQLISTMANGYSGSKPRKKSRIILENSIECIDNRFTMKADGVIVNKFQTNSRYQQSISLQISNR